MALETLNLARCTVDLHNMMTVGGMSRLAVLDLSAAHGLDARSLAILEPTSIRDLHLSGLVLDDSMIEGLTRFDALRHLDLSRTDIDDARLATLARQHPDLERLDLSGCGQISNAGLLALQRLKKLQTLDLSGCDGPTFNGLQKLELALPRCAVTRPTRFR